MQVKFGDGYLFLDKTGRQPTATAAGQEAEKNIREFLQGPLAQAVNHSMGEYDSIGFRVHGDRVFLYQNSTRFEPLKAPSRESRVEEYPASDFSAAKAFNALARIMNDCAAWRNMNPSMIHDDPRRVDERYRDLASRLDMQG